MNTGKVLAWGCGILGALTLAVILGVVLFFVHVAQDPKEMRLAVDAPATVKRGVEFDLVVNVINDRSRKPLKVSSIDIAEGYLDGFTVVSSEPAFTGSTTLPFEGGRSFQFNETVAAGTTNAFVFKLRARKTGRFLGDVDVCEGMRFKTMVAETQVE